MNLWQIEQHGRRAVAKERKYQGTGITAPAPCLAARSCSKTGDGEPELTPKHKVLFNLQTFIQARNFPTPEASQESIWGQKVKMSPRPSTKSQRKARACPIPFHTNRLASGAKSHKGHALARHIPPGPPCPHTHSCQLEQKTHPQVAIWSHAGLGPSADDRLSALLRPACCAAVGARGAGPIVTA